MFSLRAEHNKANPKSTGTVCGVRIDKVNLSQTLDIIESFIREKKPHLIVTPNVDFIYLSLKDKEFKDIINASDLATIDSTPLKWLAKFLNEEFEERVAGSDLLPAMCRLSANKGYSLYFLGAAPGVADCAKMRAEVKFPGVKIVGCYSPTSLELKTATKMIASKIRKTSPDILVTALGTPKQEKWLAGNLNMLNIPVCIGVGASLDFMAGVSKRAPIWLQRAGVEWLYRLWHEPGRLWRRYLINDMQVVFHVIQQKLGRIY